MEKTYRFVRQLNPLVLMGLMLMLVALTVGTGIRPGDPISIVVAVLVLALVMFMFYRQKSGIYRALDRRLVLDDTGLRYEISDQRYGVAWSECSHHIPRLGRDGGVRVVTLVTRKGEWLSLNRLEDMPGILATVRQYVPATGTRGWVERVLLEPWFSHPLMVLSWAGCLLFIFPFILTRFPQDQTKALGLALLAPSVFVTLYISRRNPLMKMGYAVQQGPGSPLRRFLINLGIWILVVVAVLIVLNFVVLSK